MSIFFFILWILFANFLSRTYCDSFEEETASTITELSSNLGACSAYFQYQHTDGYVNAKLVLPNLKLGDTVKTKFFYLYNVHPTLWSFAGYLLPDDSSHNVLIKLQKRQAITYRVDFIPIWRMQMLVNISINGNELCKTANDVPESRLNQDLEHTLKVVNGAIPVFKENIHMPHYSETDTCGLFDKEFTSHGATPLIYGGTDTRRGEFPWLTAIYKKVTAGGIQFNCGGSLITTKIVLTAAHCFKGFVDLRADQIVVFLGRHNLNNSNEDSSERREIEAITIHPEYRPELIISDADMALLRMSQSVSFSQFIKPICLWNEAADESLIVNRAAVVVGWGADGVGNRIANVPKKVKINIVSESECLRSSVAFNALTTKRTLCAGNQNDTGPCEGDSGGGLMLHQNNRWMLRGIISVGLTNEQRCNLYEYTVYCDVAKHLPWLNDNIKQGVAPIEGSIRDICGISGTDTRSQHPWLVAIFRKFLPGEILRCTGALISSRVVLTSTLCFDIELGDLSYYRIYLGRYDLKNTKEDSLVVRNIETASFNPALKSGINNLMLIQIDAPVSFTQYIKPICLWNEPAEQSDIVGQQVTVSSWSQWMDKETLVPFLQEGQVIPVENCTTDSHRLCVSAPKFILGGLLMLKRNGKWVLRGITNTHIFLTPLLYTYIDLVPFLSWIEGSMLPS